MARVALPLTVVDTAGNAVQGASVTIRKRSDNSLATLYTSEAGGVTTGNPATTNTQGRLPYWLDRGAYAATVTGTGITTYTENFEAAPAKDAGVDTTWGSLLTGGFTSGTLATRPATPTTTRDQYFATDDWGGTLYAATANLAGWTPVASNNQQVLDLAAVASGTFTGLNGDFDQGYRLEFSVDLSAGAASLNFQMNADVGANYSNYYAQSLNGGAWINNTSTAQTSALLAGSGGATGAMRYVGNATIDAKTGAPRLVETVSAARGATAGNVQQMINGLWANTASNLVSITVLAGSGTITGRFVLHRLSV